MEEPQRETRKNNKHQWESMEEAPGKERTDTKSMRVHGGATRKQRNSNRNPWESMEELQEKSEINENPWRSYKTRKEEQHKSMRIHGGATRKGTTTKINESPWRSHKRRKETPEEKRKEKHFPSTAKSDNLSRQPRSIWNFDPVPTFVNLSFRVQF